MSFGESMMNWLRKVEPDQNLQGIGQIELTDQSETQRRWFKRQDLTPSLDTGYYDTETERFILGSPNVWRGDSVFTTTSAAALTLTVPAGYRYEVTHAGAQNATQNSGVDLTATIGGNALTIVAGITGNTRMNTVVGAVGVSSGVNYGVEGGILMEAGDTMTLTLGAYAAGNNTEHYFIIRTQAV